MRLSEGTAVVLFDMDGTLYQDFDFHRNYLRYLLRGTDCEDLTEDVVALADGVLSRGTLPMNRFYRVCRPGRPRSPAELLARLRENMVEELPFARCYREGLGDLRFLGDPWEVAVYIAAALGTPERCGEAAFLRVRAEMEETALRADPALLALLEALRERYVTVLLSNSPEASAAGFIDRLGLSGAFSHVLYNAGKPMGLFENLRRGPGLAGVRGEQVLSVGDHAFNEIVNVHLAGGRTVWMNPYAPAPQIPCTRSVGSLEELMALLRKELL